jgi:hypothetical protein
MNQQNDRPGTPATSQLPTHMRGKGNPHGRVKPILYFGLRGHLFTYILSRLCPPPIGSRILTTPQTETPRLVDWATCAPGTAAGDTTGRNRAESVTQI